MPALDGVRTIPAVVAAQAVRHGDRTAVLDGSTSASYATLDRAASRIASSLARRGVRPGERVLLSGPNTVSWVLAALGTLRSGAVLVPVNHRVTSAEWRRTVDAVSPQLVLGGPVDPTAADEPPMPIEDLVREGEDCGEGTPGLPDVDPGDTAMVMSTSGTTGSVKLVPMRHGPLVDLYAALAPHLGIGPRDVVLGLAPLAHGFGLFGVLLDALLTGATVRLVPRYAGTGIADVVVADRVTALFAPYTVFHDLAAGGLGDRDHVVGLGLTGGSDVSLPEFRSACERIGIPRMCVGYGLTEAYGTVAFADVTRDEGDAPALTTMRRLEVRVVDPLGTQVRPGEAGEVQVRGPSVFTGYLDAQPEDRGLDVDGWLHTGDLGSLGPDRRLRVLSRIKDVVIVNGFNVVPVEVERVLQSHPDVAATVVVGIPDARSGDQLVAWVVPVVGRRPSERALLDHCRRDLAGYKVPARVLTRDVLPASVTGKPARAALRDEALVRLGR